MNTDTDRLNFINKHKYDIQFYGNKGKFCYCEESSGKMRAMGKGSNVREAIDDAMLTKLKAP